MMRPRKELLTGRRRMHGVTLVELIAFIVIMSIVAAAMVQAFSGTMRGSHLGKEATQATQLAQQRMDVILGQRKALGYSGLDINTFDPCDANGAAWAVTVEACRSTAGYTVSSSGSSFLSDACGAGTGTNCRLVIVGVTAPNGDVLSTLTYQVWNY